MMICSGGDKEGIPRPRLSGAVSLRSRRIAYVKFLRCFLLKSAREVKEAPAGEMPETPTGIRS